MTHFQVDDFSSNYGLTNPNAVSPETWFLAADEPVLSAIWARASYVQEACEPFMSNPRGMTQNPTITRIWSGPAGSTPAKIELSCAHVGLGTTYTYRFLDAAGNAVQAGTASVATQPGGLTFADFTAANGDKTLVVYKIISAQMTIAIGATGSSRAATLDNARAFTTTNP